MIHLCYHSLHGKRRTHLDSLRCAVVIQSAFECGLRKMGRNNCLSVNLSLHCGICYSLNLEWFLKIYHYCYSYCPRCAWVVIVVDPFLSIAHSSEQTWHFFKMIQLLSKGNTLFNAHNYHVKKKKKEKKSRYVHQVKWFAITDLMGA